MSVDPEATPDAGNSAAPDGTQTNWDDPSNPYLQRFKDTQAAFTRSQQELADAARLSEDFDAYKALGAEKFNLEFEDPDPEPDPAAYEQQDSRPAIDPALLEQIKEIPNLKAFQEQVLAAQAEQQFNDDLAKVAGDWDVPKVARDWIYQQTLANGGNYEALEKAAQDAREQLDGYAQATQRKRPRAPHVPAGGQPDQGSEREFKNDNERVRFMMDRLQAEAG